MMGGQEKPAKRGRSCPQPTDAVGRPAISGVTRAEVTPAVAIRYPGLRFAVIAATGIRQLRLHRLLDERAPADLETLRAQRDLIRARISSSELLLANSGGVHPLARQLERACAVGFLEGSPLVRALMRCELLSGALRGAHDAGAIVGHVTLDYVSVGGERFRTMRDRLYRPAGELVVRDDRGILASVLSGPGDRAKASRRTRTALFCVFDLPASGAGFDDGTRLIEHLLLRCSDHVSRSYATATA
jgi:hypothetical protein